MESRLLQTQQFRSLASLLDNLSTLIDDWLSIVSQNQDISDSSNEKNDFTKLLETLRNFDIPIPSVKKEEEKDKFMDEIAALSSLEVPQYSSESTLEALKTLETFSNPNQNDLSSLKLPENFDNIFVPSKGKKRRLGGMGRRAGRNAKQSFNLSNPDMFSPPSNNNPSKSKLTKKASDSFGLSSLDSLTAALRLNSETIESPRTPSRNATTGSPSTSTPLSYDDFFKGLNSAAETTSEDVVIPERDGKLIRAYGARDDMNRRGMQKIKKKTQLNAKGKGVYQMEDAHCISSPFENNSDISLFCVFDGHVDKNAAIAATTIFPEVLRDNINNFPLGSNCNDLLRKSFLDTDEKMKKYDMEGCTATSVLFWRENGIRYVQTANVGDSTAFLCRNGEAITLSFDHKVNGPSERERLLKAGLKLNEGATRINGLAVSRALGDHFIKDNFAGVTAEPYISDPYEISDTDDTILIVASDGLWDTMSGQHAMDAIKKLKDPQAMASTLVNMALSSGLCNDNITVIVVLIN